MPKELTVTRFCNPIAADAYEESSFGFSSSIRVVQVGLTAEHWRKGVWMKEL